MSPAASGKEYACAYCGRAAPPFHGDEILEWKGGELAHSGETDPDVLSLVCPECQREEREEGAGD